MTDTAIRCDGNRGHAAIFCPTREYADRYVADLGFDVTVGSSKYVRSNEVGFVCDRRSVATIEYLPARVGAAPWAVYLHEPKVRSAAWRTLYGNPKWRVMLFVFLFRLLEKRRSVAVEGCV